MRHVILAMISMFAATTLARGEESKPLLFQKPAVSRTQVAFAFAGDLWIVPREGGEAKRFFRRTGRKSPSPANTKGTWTST
jgi:tricorn protease